MAAFKGFPEINVVPGAVDGLYRIETKTGRVVVSGYFADPAEAQRIADTWNAVRKINFPSAHIEATDDYIKRLEQLRKDAVATIRTYDPDYAQ